jgi:hypothetical protein
LTIPEKLDAQGLFLLNFGPVLRDDVWDDYGNKELDQAQRLRSLAARISAIADVAEQLGHELKAYPDPDDTNVRDTSPNNEALSTTWAPHHAVNGCFTGDTPASARNCGPTEPPTGHTEPAGYTM